jgi:hypothetical protein
MKPNKTPAEPLTYYEVKSSPDLEPLPRQASAQTRIKVGEKARAIRAIRVIRARRKIRAIRKTLLNILLLTINYNLTLCQAL